ncbi:MAG TPA: SRPBCC domain-containing protein [Polyangiaceae bacterium]|nr:SRPBCC domain-containing protein [Polyangiaceae bacterium]
MTATEDLQVTLRGDCELVHTRVFAAPRELVFDALTNPDVLRRWYGPEGWTLVACDVDFRVGGHWRFVTRQPSGREIVQFGVFTEIIPSVRFTKTERWLDWDPGEVIVTTELAERDGQTTLTSITRYPSKQVRDELLAAGANRGANEHYEKLAAYLYAASAR